MNLAGRRCRAAAQQRRPGNGWLWFVLIFLPIACLGAERGWHSEKGFRWAELSVSREGKTGFTLLPPEQTGVFYTNTLTELEGAANRTLLNGSGLAIGDFDNDGWPDLFFCGLDTPTVLYRNLGGFRFQDVTEEAGLRCPGKNFRGAVFADINGDGWPDLLVSATGRGVLCFLNDGRGKFLDATQTAGTSTKLGSMTLALGDVDGNGTLDLYVTNYRAEDIRDRGRVNMHLVNGQIAVPPEFKNRLLVLNGQVLEYGEPDQLYLNDGKGNFTPVPWTDGAFLDEEGKNLKQPPLDWGLSATFRDVNGDGAPDIYVCNDYWPQDRTWINDGQGRFRAMAKHALRNTSASSMGVDFADIDRDGHLDFFVVDMLSRDPRLRKRQMPAYRAAEVPPSAVEIRPQFMRNTLFRNRGDGTFEEIAHFSGLTASDWSWQPVFLDVDLDGFEDLLVPAGNHRDVQDLDATAQIDARQHSWKGYTNESERQKAFTQERMVHNQLYPFLALPIIAFRNQGNLTFAETTRSWGTDQPGVHHGMAVGDLDGDGDLDFVVNNFGDAAGIYRNDSPAQRIVVRLRGTAPNTEGIGSKVTLRGGAVPIQSQEVVCGGRYLSGSEPRIVFAAGRATNELKIEVIWRSGQRSVVEFVKPNCVYEIEEAFERSVEALKRQSVEASLAPASRITHHAPALPRSHAPTLFEDVSNLLAHTHTDEPFDDFARQPLLPRKLSQLGPGVAWFDVNDDGWEDLIVGSGRGGQLGVFLNNSGSGFKSEPPFPQPVTRDQTGIVGLRREDGTAMLLVGSANYEDGLAVGASVRQYNFTRKSIDDTFPGHASSAGPLALADVDGDGDLDLFVGGRVVAGRYPEAASSRLFRRHNGRWEQDAEATKMLANIGLVSGAVWCDLNEDGFAELILACEWGPIRVFRNERGTFAPWNWPVTFTNRASTLNAQRSTLNDFTGWWTGITAGDIDSDGRMDLIAGNWGLNSPYRASLEQPLRLYFGDFAQRSTLDLIETELDPATRTERPVRMLNPIAYALPFLRERFPSHKLYSDASSEDLLKALPAKASEARATTLASTIFFNRGSRFEAVELPREAQLAPAFGVSVGDFDGDGSEDVFLSQNFFGTQTEMPRLDAGRGLLLKGDGKGQLVAVAGQESGLQAYGEQRGAAVADFNADGRLDLAVTQNRDETRLFRNVSAKPGFRVKLKGPAGNLTGIGAVIWPIFTSGNGPAREIHAGSGYWSQDSAVQVIGLRDGPMRVAVRWPGGRTTTTEIPTGTKEVTIDTAGNRAR
ncbi:MAG: VCBS repeat-containing protein [Verrucomicrobia bacterium]|nr:VCBS repeat-containing protein [Verrucomicrobiota bacterium]